MLEIVHPIEVRLMEGYRLHLRFEDGTAGEIDFSERPLRGVFAPLRDPCYFAQVRVDDEIGTIAWPNGADIAPETLHKWVLEGKYPYSE